MKIIKSEFIKPGTISCHAASILYYKNDRILSWFGGTAEGSCDTQVYIQVNDLAPWTLLKPSDYEDYGIFYQLPFWNPVLIAFGKELFIFFKQGKFCDCWTTFAAKLKTSKSSSPVEIQRLRMLPAGQCGPAKNRPLIDEETDLMICGASYETAYSWTSALEWFDPLQMEAKCTESRVTVNGEPGKKGIIQPALFWTEKEKHVAMVMRSDLGFLFATSWPGGRLVNTGIPNPNSSIDIIRHSSGRLFMAYNPKTYDRLPLVLQEIEEDSGRIIKLKGDPLPIETHLEAVPGVEVKHISVVYPIGILPKIIGLTAEASYPSLCESPEGKIECAYTYGRRIIKIATVEII